MALNEFAPGRENIQSEVNAFLKEQWGIDSYLQLIPVVLIQSDTKKEGKHAAFPIVRSNLYSETTGVEWAGYASGEDQMLGIRFEGYSGKIKMVGVPIQTGTEWKVTGNLWQELSENRGGYFPKRVFGKVAGLLLCSQFYARSTWPERIHFMRRLENLYSHVGWAGKCPNCGSWGSLVETFFEEGEKGEAREKKRVGGIKPVSLSSIPSRKTSRISTKISELDRVLGGGLVPGQVVLIAGEPGIGKSTLLLQLADKIGDALFILGEESTGH